MGDALARVVTGRPRLVLALALVVTLAALPFAARLRLDTDVYDLFPQDQPVASAFARFSRAFVTDPMVVVLVESPDPARLDAFVDPFAEALRRSPRIAEVRHRLSGDGARFFRDHLVALLDDAELDVLRARTEPEAVRARLRRVRGLLTAPGGSALAPLYAADPLELAPLVGKRIGAGVSIDASSGLFKSADGRALLLYVRARDAAPGPETTRALLAEIAGAAAPLGGLEAPDGAFQGGGVELSFTGPSVYALHYRDWLHHDMTVSTALSALSVLLLFGLFFGALRVLPLVGFPLALGVVWTGALAHLAFGRVNAVSLAFGTILISIGIDLPIQLFNRLREELAAAPPAEALRRTVARYASPAVLATLGPAAVFLACATSRFRGLRELGALAAIGLVVNCVAMLTVFPAALAALPGRLWGARAVPLAAGGPFRALGRLAARRPRIILFAAGLALVGAAPFALRVRFDRALFAQPPLMAPSRVQEELERRFGQRDGAAIAYVEARGEGAVEAVLERSDAWLVEGTRLRDAGLLRGLQSLSLIVPSERTQRARWARLAAIDPRARAAGIRAALDELGFDPAPFAGFLAQLEGPFAPVRVEQLPGELDFVVRLHLHRDPGEARIATYLYPASGAREAEALAAIQRVADGPPGGVVTGKPLLEPVLREAAQRDLARATALAAALVVLLVALHQRRWRPTVAILTPLVLAWVLFGAALTLFRIPLNLYSLLAVPLVIGYGIDDHVFLLSRHAEDPRAGIGDAVASTGRAIVVTSLSTMAGFLPIAFARFPALRLLGLTGALAVALCLVAALAVLPALLALLFDARGEAS